MEIISDLTITGESVCLDEKHFINCSLRGCVLSYSGGGVIFERTIISQCRHVFYGAARQTVLYLQEVGLWGTEPAMWGEFSGVVN